MNQVCHLDGRDALGLAKLQSLPQLQSLPPLAAGGDGGGGGLVGGGDADAAVDAALDAANAAAATAPPCRCHGCRLTLCAAPERAVRRVRLELLVHRTSRGRARMALHGEEGYRQRVGARLRVTG